MHPRILIISQNWDYTNPTRHLLHQELSRKYGAILSGWNYKENPNDAKFKLGDIDAVIVDPWALSDTVSRHYVDIKPVDVRDYNAPIFLNLLAYDIHNLDQGFFSNIVGGADYVLSACTSAQFLPGDYSYALEHEPWLDPSSILIKNPELVNEKFILVPHAISKGEFQFLDFANRRYDVSILGAPYQFRREARRLFLNMHNIDCVCNMGKSQSLLGRMSNHYILGPRFGFTYLYRHRFRKLIANSRLSVTCDGSIGYPIRKFFEVPANGAVLAASFFPNARELGFKDGENCLFVDRHDVSALREIGMEARGGGTRMRALAAAGQDMIRELHTVEKRADQIMDVVTAVLNVGRVRTSWRDGRLKISAQSTANVTGFKPF